MSKRKIDPDDGSGIRPSKEVMPSGVNPQNGRVIQPLSFMVAQCFGGGSDSVISKDLFPSMSAALKLADSFPIIESMSYVELESGELVPFPSNDVYQFPLDVGDDYLSEALRHSSSEACIQIVLWSKTKGFRDMRMRTVVSSDGQRRHVSVIEIRHLRMLRRCVIIGRCRIASQNVPFILTGSIMNLPELRNIRFNSAVWDSWVASLPNCVFDDIELMSVEKILEDHPEWEPEPFEF